MLQLGMNVCTFLRSAYVYVVVLASVRAVAACSDGSSSGLGDAGSFNFGGCDPGKEACKDCYLTLVKSLLGNGANVLNLTDAFFPPNLNPPDSVIVTYHFHNKSKDNSSVWFWATSFGYFLHPTQYFQFISLLFGKPRPLYERRVEVTLDADCMGASDKFMQVLTQRLKGYIEWQSIYARIDESRIASAINEMSLKKIINTYGDDAENLVTTFSIASPLIISILSIFIISLLTITGFRIYILREREDNSKHPRSERLKLLLRSCLASNTTYTKRKKGAILSSVAIGFVRLFLIVALDASATHYTQNLSEPELGRIHHESNTEHKILYVSPYILLALDVFFLIAYGTSVITCCALIKYGDRGYYCLLLTICVPMASILLHLPYIAIAYLNDANHAGSVLILYTVVTFLEFIILQFIFIQWFNLKPVNSRSGTQAVRSDRYELQELAPAKRLSPNLPHTQEEGQSRVSDQQSAGIVIANLQCHSQEIHVEPSSAVVDAHDPVCTQRETKRESRFSLRRFVCFGLIVFSSLLPLYCMVGICVSFFYYLPINHSISSTSNQIIIVYQTGLVFVGAIVAYKTIFKKRDKFVEALDECEDKVKDSLLKKEKNVNWVASTDQEKLNIFYRHVITYIILKVTREAQENETSGTPDPGPGVTKV